MPTKQQDADRILIAHVQDMATRGAYRSFTPFLDMRQYTLVRSILTAGTYRFFGGYADASRGILCVHPADCPPEDDEFPITCLTYTFPEAYTVTHRDVLGCLMAQQVQRDTVGDILIAPGRAQCFVTAAAVTAGMQLTKIGRIGVKVTDQLPFADDYVQEVREIVGTVATPRLDAILRTALAIGRNAVLPLITGGAVMLNYAPAERPDKLLAEGDVFSVRGYGKFRIRELGELTRKGRLRIVIERYL